MARRPGRSRLRREDPAHELTGLMHHDASHEELSEMRESLPIGALRVYYMHLSLKLRFEAGAAKVHVVHHS